MDRRHKDFMDSMREITHKAERCREQSEPEDSMDDGLQAEIEKKFNELFDELFGCKGENDG